MKWTVSGSIFKVKQGDITDQNTDAVVNAANKELAPGGGVAGAIHRAGGQELTDHCRELDRCETGQAVRTPGFDLDASKIIHTVGPIYDAHMNPEVKLRESYLNSLELAKDENLGSISFPLLSTGAFGYPVEEASKVALRSIRDFLQDQSTIKEVRMILWGEEHFDLFRKQAVEILGSEDH